MLVALLPANLQPYAKAVAAALAGVLITVTQGLVTGTFDTGELVTGIGSVISTLLVYQTPNSK